MFPSTLKEIPFSTYLLKYNKGDLIYNHIQPFLHLLSPNVSPLTFNFSHTILSKVSPSLKPSQLNTFPTQPSNLIISPFSPALYCVYQLKSLPAFHVKSLSTHLQKLTCKTNFSKGKGKKGKGCCCIVK